MDSHIFDFNLSGIDSSGDFLAEMPKGITNREALFDNLNKAFSFPYFGRNWDALWDLLNDLSWIKQKRVILVHHDVPSLDQHQLSIYLEILRDAVDNWKLREPHDFLVVLPQ